MKVEPTGKVMREIQKERELEAKEGQESKEKGCRRNKGIGNQRERRGMLK